MYIPISYRSSQRPFLESFPTRFDCVQVQDVVATVESVQQLMSIQAGTHWAGQPGQKLILADAFRSLVREGELQMVSA